MPTKQQRAGVCGVNLAAQQTVKIIALVETRCDIMEKLETDPNRVDEGNSEGMQAGVGRARGTVNLRQKIGEGGGV